MPHIDKLSVFVPRGAAAGPSIHAGERPMSPKGSARRIRHLPKHFLRIYCSLVKAARDRPTGGGHANFFWKHFLGMFFAYAPLHEREAYRCRCRSNLKLGAVTRVHNLVDLCLV
jgi:hypothetical protein